jgi:hypothetical protein
VGCGVQSSADLLIGMIQSLDVESSVGVLASLSMDVSSEALLVREALNLDSVSRVGFHVLGILVEVDGTLVLSSSTLTTPVLSEFVVTPVTSGGGNASSKCGNSERFHK